MAEPSDGLQPQDPRHVRREQLAWDARSCRCHPYGRRRCRAPSQAYTKGKRWCCLVGFLCCCTDRNLSLQPEAHVHTAIRQLKVHHKSQACTTRVDPRSCVTIMSSVRISDLRSAWRRHGMTLRILRWSTSDRIHIWSRASRRCRMMEMQRPRFTRFSRRSGLRLWVGSLLAS